ncbi:MAG: UDP-N-acetylmuramoyl-L-alanyl-D-glutamate--2,6-diaminopimelate ligase [Nitrospirae bacterium]|nr:UDP-N-acetylmuramoyl-L-alanyl-D-glutamate--2,6-diaminopimelate ligase [Nitrospirota bacterium]
MKLRELLQNVDIINVLQGCDYTPSLTLPPEGGGQGWGGLDIDISGVSYNSRKVKEGHLFVALKGEKYDGHDFIKEAIKNGAVAVVYDSEINFSLLTSHFPLLKVRDSRKALACITNNFYGRPSERLTIIGITGTNGKTTTTYLLKSILESWGKEIGLIGTIQYMIKDKSYSALYTTPEALEFHGLLRDMLLSGCTHIISEVSSHALAQSRVNGTVFKTVVFTNLTRDHLDFHKTMEDYFRAKERLFRELLDKDGTSVINLDDLYGKRLNSKLKTQNSKLKKILTYGLEIGADIMARDINSSFEGLRFKIAFRGRNYNISSALIGLPNVYNIMAAAGASISIGVPWDIILEGIKNAGTVTGRFEKVNLNQNFLCIVDYAHTEDALERLILTARELIKKSLVNPPTHPSPSRGEGEGGGENSELPGLALRSGAGRTPNSLPRGITVFGCGGDRDCGKRPKMGSVATKLSDFVIITSDNPRSEDPNEIIREIEAGAVRRNYLIEPDRAEAIKRAIMLVGDGDIVLVAGKGHEDYQEIKGVRYRFNDREILEKAIKQRIKGKNNEENRKS